MNKLGLALLLATLGFAPAQAQVIPQPSQQTVTGCVFNVVPPTLAVGQAGFVQCDSSGRLTFGAANSTIAGANGMIPVRTFPVGTPLAEGGITPVVCGSAVSSCVFKAAGGNFYSAYAECSAACWLMVFNSATAPSNGATTAGIASGNMVHCVPIAAGGTGSIANNGMPPDIFTVGITAVISSTTCATLTLATTGFINGKVQ